MAHLKDLDKITLDAIRELKIAILGYGNQGRAQALNLRDSGLNVIVGARIDGQAGEQARKDGFTVATFPEAARASQIVMFLLPDHVIPDVFAEVQSIEGFSEKYIGFAHGYAYHFGGLSKFAGKFFLVGPKGAGAILRENFVKGGGLPGVFALSVQEPSLRAAVLAYAKGIGVTKSRLIETTFQEETECDLFGEQAVLCGGIFQLMEAAFETLVKNGHTPDMAFFETCFEAKTILDLWMKYGPTDVVNRISPTAFYGGLTRGKRVVTEDTRAELAKIFTETRSGKFHEEWSREVAEGFPLLKKERERLTKSPQSKAWEENH